MWGGNLLLALAELLVTNMSPTMETDKTGNNMERASLGEMAGALSSVVARKGLF